MQPRRAPYARSRVLHGIRTRADLTSGTLPPPLWGYLLPDEFWPLGPDRNKLTFVGFTQLEADRLMAKGRATGCRPPRIGLGQSLASAFARAKPQRLAWLDW